MDVIKRNKYIGLGIALFSFAVFIVLLQFLGIINKEIKYRDPIFMGKFFISLFFMVLALFGCGYVYGGPKNGFKWAVLASLLFVLSYLFGLVIH